MTQLSPTPTQKGNLPKKKRISVPIRLLPEFHAELKQAGIDEQRSMGFIALRRYLKGYELEQEDNA